MPFSSLHLKGPRPRSLPRGYPIEPKTLGDHLRKCRLDRGLGQRIVAQTLGVREETVGLWENGLARPLPCHYGRIVQFLGYDPEPADSTVAGRLRAVRRRLGLTQAKLATLAGLDEGSICRWESGSREPSRWMTSRVTAILDRLEQAKELTAKTLEHQPMSYFDRTRWRRRPPPDLTDGEPASLGERIRHRRLELGLSQEQLAQRIGVGRGAIRRWERGISAPHPTRRTHVLQFLGGRWKYGAR